MQMVYSGNVFGCIQAWEHRQGSFHRACYMKTTQIRFRLCNVTLFIASTMRKGYVKQFFTFGIYACTALNIILWSRMFLQKVIRFNVVMFIILFLGPLKSHLS